MFFSLIKCNVQYGLYSAVNNNSMRHIIYFNLFLLLQLTHSHWNFKNPWSLQGSEAKRRFCLHVGQASTSRPASTIICYWDKICQNLIKVWQEYWQNKVFQNSKIVAEMLIFFHGCPPLVYFPIVQCSTWSRVQQINILGEMLNFRLRDK